MREVRTVLLVEDYQPLLKRWARELEHAGKRVLAATTGTAALDLARAQHPDVAIVDLFLANENGINVIRQLKEEHAKLYAVLVSAHLSVAYAIAAVRAGANDVVFKPVSFKRLIAILETGGEAELAPGEEELLTLDEVEWEHISRVLIDCEGNITHAAERLGIYRQTLQRKLRKHTKPDS